MPSKYTPFDLEHTCIPYAELCSEHFEMNLDIWVLYGVRSWVDELGFQWTVNRYTYATAYRKTLSLKYQDPRFLWGTYLFYDLPQEEVLHGVPTASNPFGF